MHPRLFHIHALSALHCGTGQSAGVVDLPIARARATQLPIVPGSSLRGVLRQQVTDDDPAAARTLFGPDAIRASEDSFAGALAVGDAHLLVLPVRCLAGIVSYVTAPFVLQRYRRDLTRAGLATPKMPVVLNDETAMVLPDSVNTQDGTLVLEDLDLRAKGDPMVGAWATLIAEAAHPDDADARADLASRFAIVPDGIFGFLAETATEIRARIAIDPTTGTVKKGALWYEENLPAEALLWGVYALSDANVKDDTRSADALAACLPQPGTLLQLGGKAGIGRGLVRFLTTEAAA